MDIAVVTGGNSGIGLAISKKLITLGFCVHAIADDFSKTPFAHKDFISISVANNDTAALIQAAQNILENINNLCIFVNAQDRKPNFPLNAISLENLESQFNQSLLHPLLLTRLFIDKLRQFQGFIINIAYENPCNSLSAGIEGGLSSFYYALFEEYRQQGVNITQLILGSVDDSNPVNGDMMANTIDHLIRFRGGNAVTTITIRPQNAQALTKIPQMTPSIDEFREIQLPTKTNFPKHQEPIETLEPISRRKSSPPKAQKLQKPLKSPKAQFQEKTPKTPERKSQPKETATPAPITTPKIARDSIVIPRKRKQDPPKTESTEQKVPEYNVPLIETPKVTRDTVVIPREKKNQKPQESPILKPEAKSKTKLESNPEPTHQPNTRAKPTLRIRRGRPSTKKES